MKRGRIIPGRNPQQKKTNSSSSSKKSSYTAMNPRTRQSITTNKKSTANAGDNVSKNLGAKDAGKNYNVGVSKGGVSFGEAFKHFRNQGDKEFTWNGKKYHTKTKEEM